MKMKSLKRFCLTYNHYKKSIQEYIRFTRLNLSKTKNFVETTTNPFEGNESIFLSTDNRATQRRKGKKRKGRFSYKQEHEDSEIQAEIDKGLAVNIL